MAISGFISNKRGLYWIAQVLGWGAYFLLIWITNDLEKKGNGTLLIASLFLCSILITHFNRWIIIRFDWFKSKPAGILWRILVASFVMATAYRAISEVIEQVIMFRPPDLSEVTTGRWLTIVVIDSIFYFMWQALYFAYHFIGKARQEEIKNLQWEASKTEIELKNLKAQLNPHFMFNSMNSIRALIDENPAQAKFAVTQLSSILRNTLLMGKSKTVQIKDELNVVKDYLSLEGIRYEERLKVGYDVDGAILDCEIPPMMIQTLVENAIKHGISKLPEGGYLNIYVGNQNEKIEVRVENSGHLNGSNPTTGIGLKNTQKRLDLLYGEEAMMEISSNGGKVVTQVVYPKLAYNEGSNNR